MHLIRTIEDEISINYSKQEMRCPIHLSIGQEAAAVGVCSNLTFKDKFFSTHRCHAHYLAKGGSIDKMIGEIYGKVTGCCKGRGGSMHLFDEAVGLSSSIPIVASSIPLAVGNALADKLTKKRNVSVASFGDASIEEGIFYESLNFAIIKKLPVLFLCENNLYSVMTHLEERQSKNFIKKINRLYDLPLININGNNVVNVYKKSRNLINYIKKNNKPAILVLNTYRYKEHCGPNEDAHLAYRKDKEVNFWKKLDPILLCEKKIKNIFKIQQITFDKIHIFNKKICQKAHLKVYSN